MNKTTAGLKQWISCNCLMKTFRFLFQFPLLPTWKCKCLWTATYAVFSVAVRSQVFVVNNFWVNVYLFLRCRCSSIGNGGMSALWFQIDAQTNPTLFLLPYYGFYISDSIFWSRTRPLVQLMSQTFVPQLRPLSSNEAHVLISHFESLNNHQPWLSQNNRKS